MSEVLMGQEDVNRHVVARLGEVHAKLCTVELQLDQILGHLFPLPAEDPPVEELAEEPVEELADAVDGDTEADEALTDAVEELTDAVEELTETLEDAGAGGDQGDEPESETEGEDSAEPVADDTDEPADESSPDDGDTDAGPKLRPMPGRRRK